MGKVKFRRGEVVHCGDQKSATEYILSHGGEGRVIVGATVTAGYAGIIPGIRLGRRWIVTRHAYEQWERTCGTMASDGESGVLPDRAA